MPFVNVHIGKKISEEMKENLANMIARNMPIILGKTADNTMIEISDDREMYMSGDREGIIFVDMRVFRKIPNEIKNAFVEKLSTEFDRMLDVSVNCQYFNIQEYDGWGYGGHFNAQD